MKTSAKGGSLVIIVRALLREAVALEPHARADAVHTARKRMKCIRAGLRLLRGTLGETLYRSANQGVRDAARPLTPVRDAVVLLKSIKHLGRRMHRPHLESQLTEASRLLVIERSSGREQLSAAALRRRAARLKQIYRRLKAARAEASDLESVLRGIKSIYRKGRGAGAEARRRPRVKVLHEWRKQAKYLANAATLMHRLFSVRLKKIRRESRELGSLLGEHHDWVLLQAKLDELYQSGSLPEDKSALSAFHKLIKRRRSKLRITALRLGKRLYHRTPHKFIAAMRKSLQKS